MEKWRALVVITLSLELTFLAAIIALGKVVKDTSYGLEIVLMALGGALAAVLVTNSRSAGDRDQDAVTAPQKES